MTPPVKSGPRYNNLIQSDKVRVIDENGENLGVMYTREAIEQAAEVGLDLVEVSPNADPPVCKFLDVGKFRYEAQKKANLARKTQKTQEIKEIKMRPNIDDHDYDVKMRSVQRFIEEGDKVKITLRFRGREMSHQQLGMELLAARAGRRRRGREGRSLSAHGRPPDADGALAEVRTRVLIQFSPHRPALGLKRARGSPGSPPPLAALLGAAQHFVGELVGVERCGGVRVAGVEVGVDVLGLGAPRFLHRLEIGIGGEPEQLERTNLVAAAAAVARASPAIVRWLAVARMVAGLGALARRRFLGGEPGEVVPVGVVLGRMALAEIPALGAVR